MEVFVVFSRKNIESSINGFARKNDITLDQKLVEDFAKIARETADAPYGSNLSEEYNTKLDEICAAISDIKKTDSFLEHLNNETLQGGKSKNVAVRLNKEKLDSLSLANVVGKAMPKREPGAERNKDVGFNPFVSMNSNHPPKVRGPSDVKQPKSLDLDYIIGGEKKWEEQQRMEEESKAIQTSMDKNERELADFVHGVEIEKEVEEALGKFEIAYKDNQDLAINELTQSVVEISRDHKSFSTNEEYKAFGEGVKTELNEMKNAKLSWSDTYHCMASSVWSALGYEEKAKKHMSDVSVEGNKKLKFQSIIKKDEQSKNIISELKTRIVTHKTTGRTTPARPKAGPEQQQR